MHFPSSSARLVVIRSLAALVASLAIAAAACSGATQSPGDSSNDGSSDSSKSGGSRSGSNPGAPYGEGCTYPKIENPPGCPPEYRRHDLGSCEPIGLDCWYPGVGGSDDRGCSSTALLACFSPRDDDAGDAGKKLGVWVAAQ